jgi:hypothetical protein
MPLSGLHTCWIARSKTIGVARSPNFDSRVFGFQNEDQVIPDDATTTPDHVEMTLITGIWFGLVWFTRSGSLFFPLSFCFCSPRAGFYSMCNLPSECDRPPSKTGPHTLIRHTRAVPTEKPKPRSSDPKLFDKRHFLCKRLYPVKKCTKIEKATAPSISQQHDREKEHPQTITEPDQLGYTACTNSVLYSPPIATVNHNIFNLKLFMSGTAVPVRRECGTYIIISRRKQAPSSTRRNRYFCKPGGKMRDQPDEFLIRVN